MATGPAVRPPSTNPARNAFDITPHATNTLAAVTRGLYVGVGGDVNVRLVGSQSDHIFKNVPSGTTLAIEVDRVYVANTTATNMIGLH
jgi:hypothetical protein